MRILVFFSFFLSFFSFLQAGEILSGEISGFLKASPEPYFVKETIVLKENKALIIEAGTILEFAKDAGFEIQGGSFAITGTKEKPVLLKAKDSLWKGVSLTGEKPVDLQYTYIENAKIGLALEKGVLNFYNSKISGSKEVGIFVKSSVLNAENTEIKNKNAIGIYASENAEIKIRNSKISENNIGVFAAEKSTIDFHSTSVSENAIGILKANENTLTQNETKVSGNQKGIVSSEILSENFKNSVVNNKEDYSAAFIETKKMIPAIPENEFAKNYAFKKTSVSEKSEKSIWTLSGNVSLEVGYHLVFMRKNHSGEDFIMATDTVKDNERYKNYFQVPGLFGNINANLLLTSTDGKSLEFVTTLSSDSWNRFQASEVRTTYTDKFQKIILGDFYATEGELYLSGVNVLGASYSLNLFRNFNNEPLISLNVFGGETKAPLYFGEKNPSVFKDYIDEGEAEAQSMILKTSVKVNPIRRFNATLGFISSKDYLEDPFLRDGMSGNTSTLNPILSSKTFYADGNWLFYPGDIELNGQIAFGAADTSNVLLQRALNQVFSDAGFSVSNFTKLRELAKNESRIKTLSRSELLEIFEDEALSTTEMKTILLSLVKKAKQVEKTFANAKNDKTNISDYDGKNLAFQGSLRFEFNKTLITSYLKWTGQNFYSAGSPDALNNTREFGATLEQEIFNFWKLALQYDLDIENAGNGNQYNFFGFGEGTTWGLFPNKNSSWYKDHELDDNRTHYIHNASVKQDFKITKNVDLSLKYGMDYRTRSKKTRLYGNYSATSGIYNDPWFLTENKKEAYTVVSGDDTLFVDSAKFNSYYSLVHEPYLASRFNERLLKHTIAGELHLRLPKTDLKLGGIFTFRKDYSEFENDSLIQDFDFSSQTFEILGYDFHGTDYFEQKYPVSLTNKFSKVVNYFTVMPRFKFYNRDSMKEYEWNVSNNLEITLSENFLDLFVTGTFREGIFKRNESSGNLRELEIDLEGQTTLRVHYTSNLYSDWTVGAFYYYRPDSRDNEYRDILLAASLNYEF